VVLTFLECLDILFDQVGPSHLDDLGFRVAQVLRGTLTYPSLECLGRPSTLLHLFCLCTNECMHELTNKSFLYQLEKYFMLKYLAM
jgi:hypothetical protein